MQLPSKTLVLPGILSILTLLATGASASVIAAYDFNTASDTEGWTATSTSGFTAVGGSLVGTATGNDPQLLNNPVSITVGVGGTWDTVVFRVRELDSASGFYIGSAGAPAFNTVGLVIQVNSLVISTGFTSVASGDDFYTVTTNISSLAATTITNIRVDPVGGALSNSGSETNGNSYEVDFIQINGTAVPEPSAALLGGLGMIALLRRRR